MTDTSLIEAVQNAIDGALPGEDAKAAIAAVRLWEAENGWRCVPAVADKAMYGAGEHAWMHRDLNDDDSGPIRDCYRAMVSASPPPPGSDEGVKP